MHRAPWYEQWLWNAVSPATYLFSWGKGGIADTWSHYFALVSAAKENDRLRGELGELGQIRADREGLQQENQRLKELLGLHQTQWPDSIPAVVVAFDPKAELKSIRIDKGYADGVVSDMAVVAQEGLVGRVGPVYKRDALVLLITDPANFVDVMVQRSQVRSLLAGLGSVRHLQLGHFYFLTRMEYLKKDSEIAVDDRVVTSGMDQLYPAGILVGTVTGLKLNPHGVFLRADVLPVVDFSKLREVLVLKKRE